MKLRQVRILALVVAVLLAAAPLAPVLAQNTAAEEIADWEAIAASKNPSDFKMFLEKYPNGARSGVARGRLEQLTKSPEDQARDKAISQAVTDWQAIANSNNAADFQRYIQKYPTGLPTELAKERLKKMAAAAAPLSKEQQDELDDWQAISGSRQASDYKMFVEKYPSGPRAEIAKERLGKIARGEPFTPALAPQPSASPSPSTSAVAVAPPRPAARPWAAFSYNVNGGWSAVWKEPTREDAERKLESVCRKNKNKCKEVSFQNCISLATWKRGRGWGVYASGGESLVKAMNSAMDDCRSGQGGSNCNTRTTICADGSHKG